MRKLTILQVNKTGKTGGGSKTWGKVCTGETREGRQMTGEGRFENLRLGLYWEMTREGRQMTGEGRFDILRLGLYWEMTREGWQMTGEGRFDNLRLGLYW